MFEKEWRGDKFLYVKVIDSLQFTLFRVQEINVNEKA